MAQFVLTPMLLLYSQVTEEDLKSVLLQSRGHFPDKPELWLKDLVTYLNMRLEGCPESDKYLSKDNTGTGFFCWKLGTDSSLCRRLTGTA